MESRKVYNQFIKIEKDNLFFKYSDKNDYSIWQILRYDIFTSITQPKITRKISRKNLLKFIFRIFSSHLKIFYKRIDYLYIGSSRKIENINKDLSFEFLKECTNNSDNLLFSETNIESIRNNYNGYFSFDPLLKFLSRRLFIINSREREIISFFSNKLKEEFPKKSFDISWMISIYNYYKLQFIYYNLFIRLKNPKKIFFVKNGMYYGLILASKKNNIKIFEFQHGDIVKQDVSISFPKIKDSRLLCPDFHLVYSTSWTDKIYTSSTCIEIGYNNFSNEKSKISGFSKNSILIIMDLIEEKKFLNLTKHLAKNLNKKIILKLHPRQYSRKDYFFQLFSSNKNIQILTSDFPLSQLLYSIINIVGSYSTAIYEAYDAGCNLFLWNLNSLRSFNFPNLSSVHYFENSKHLIELLNNQDFYRIKRKKVFFKDINKINLKKAIYEL